MGERKRRPSVDTEDLEDTAFDRRESKSVSKILALEDEDNQQNNSPNNATKERKAKTTSKK